MVSHNAGVFEQLVVCHAQTYRDLSSATCLERCIVEVVHVPTLKVHPHLAVVRKTGKQLSFLPGFPALSAAGLSARRRELDLGKFEMHFSQL